MSCSSRISAITSPWRASEGRCGRRGRCPRCRRQRRRGGRRRDHDDAVRHRDVGEHGARDARAVAADDARRRRGDQALGHGGRGAGVDAGRVAAHAFDGRAAEEQAASVDLGDRGLGTLRHLLGERFQRTGEAEDDAELDVFLGERRTGDERGRGGAKKQFLHCCLPEWTKSPAGIPRGCPQEKKRAKNPCNARGCEPFRVDGRPCYFPNLERQRPGEDRCMIDRRQPMATAAAIAAARPAAALVHRARAGADRVMAGLDEPWGSPSCRAAGLVTERDGRLLRLARRAQPRAFRASRRSRPGAGRPSRRDGAARLRPSRARSSSASRAAGPGRGHGACRRAVGGRRGPAVGRAHPLRGRAGFRGGRHFGSRIVEAPDGRLFLTIGDRGDDMLRAGPWQPQRHGRPHQPRRQRAGRQSLRQVSPARGPRSGATATATRRARRSTSTATS
jgi:hypothetical protein